MPTLTTTYSSVTDSTALTCTIASLATSAGLLAGRETTLVTNVTDLFLDALLTGQIMTGTTPTVGAIEVWLWALTRHVASVPSYPSGITGVDAAVTFVADTKSRLILVDSMTTNATSNQAYTIRPRSVASLCDGIMPIKWGCFVTHSTVAALNATATNHWLHVQGIKFTST